jgi:hypothetical protein
VGPGDLATKSVAFSSYDLGRGLELTPPFKFRLVTPDTTDGRAFTHIDECMLLDETLFARPCGNDLMHGCFSAAADKVGIGLAVYLAYANLAYGGCTDDAGGMLDQGQIKDLQEADAASASPLYNVARVCPACQVSKEGARWAGVQSGSSGCDRAGTHAPPC